MGDQTLDLTTGVPRSGHDKVGGIVMLARAIDKMRAHLAGTLGEYISHRGFSVDVFELFGTDAATFEEIVRTHDTDEGVLESLYAIKHPTSEEIAAFNLDMATWPVNDEAALARLRERLADGAHAHRTDLTSGMDTLDLDEGREVPVGGRHHADAQGH